MNDLAWALSDTDATRSQSLAEKAQTLSKSIQEGTGSYQLGVGYSLRTSGYVNMRLGNYPLGLTQLFEAQEIFESLDHLEGLPDVFDGIAAIYMQMGSFAEALDYAYRQLEAAQKINDERLIANAYNNVAEIRRSTGDYEHAVEILRNNLETATEIGYKRIESISHMNLAETYWVVEEYDKALEHGEAALRMNQKVGFELFEVYSFMIIGETYRRMGETAQALHNLEQALRLTRRIESKVFEPLILVRIARTYRSEQRDDFALEYLLRAREVAQSISARTELAEAHRLLSELYEEQGNLGQALYHFKEYHSTKENIYNDRTDQRLSVLKVAYDTETSRREAEMLQLRTVELSREISERRQIEEALRESESKFRNFVEQSSDGIVLVNERGLIVEWNSGAEQLTGLRRETVLDTPLWEVQVRLLPYERKTPEAGEQYKAMILAALQTGEASWLKQMNEVAYQRGDGDKRFAQQHLFPIETDAGFWLGAISTDITERKEAEEKLRKLSQAVEQSGSTIIITDAQGVIEFVNPAFSRTSGYAASEAIGQNPRLLTSGRMPPEVFEDLWATITRGEVWAGELFNRKKDGQLYWEAAIISPIRDKAGRISHYVAVQDDITERKKAEAALQEAHDRLERRVAERTVELQEAVESLRQEVIQRERAEAETQRRLIIQQSLAAMSTELMQATDFEQAVAHTLAETGKLVGANRVFLVRLESDGEAIHRIQEWCAPGVAPVFRSVESWTFSGAPWLIAELQERGWLYFNDITQSPPELQDSIIRHSVDAGEAHCAIPVYAGEEMIGFLGCDGLDHADQGLQPHLPVLEVVVGILGSALLRERVLATLEQRVADRTEQLSAFFDLTTLAGGEEDLSDMLAPAVVRILELGSCQAICIHLLDEERAILRLVAQGNLPEGAHHRLQAIALERAFLERIDQSGVLLVSADLAALAALPPPFRLEGFQSYLGVPLQAGGQSYGWVSFYRVSPQGFGLDESSLLVALAEQVSVIAENYRLRQRIKAAIALEERGRLARDLHDSVTQSLYSLSLFARSGRYAAEEGDTEQLATSLTRLETNALQALREMRLLLYELRPETLDQEGLIRTIERRFDAVERRAGMKATVVHQVEDGLELPQTLERELYYFTMEALNNILKHARATEVTVSVWSSAFRLEFEITDDGCGFDPRQVSNGYGLGHMHERIEGLGGRLEISSSPGAGTRIFAQVDLP